MANKLTIEFDAFASGCLPGTLESTLKQVRAQATAARKRGEEAYMQQMLDDCVGQLESCLASVVEARRRYIYGDAA